MPALITGGFLVRCRLCSAEIHIPGDQPSEALDRAEEAGWDVDMWDLLPTRTYAQCPNHTI